MVIKVNLAQLSVLLVSADQSEDIAQVPWAKLSVGFSVEEQFEALLQINDS